LSACGVKRERNAHATFGKGATLEADSMEKMDEQASLQRPFAHAFGESSIQSLAGSTWRRLMPNTDPYNGILFYELRMYGVPKSSA
jgi:hypothetical protein